MEAMTQVRPDSISAYAEPIDSKGKTSIIDSRWSGLVDPVV
jgi:hypothetical protein